MRITTTDLARSIAFQFNKSIKDRVDELLKADCSNYTNLGTDSTDEEKNLVKDTSKEIYQIINLIDEQTGSLLIKSIDS